MTKKTYNGWKNWETWAVVINLENTYDVYKMLRRYNYTNFKQFEADFKPFMVDDVNWNVVSKSEIRAWHNELKNS